MGTLTNSPAGKKNLRTERWASLMLQWLRPYPSTAGAMNSTPGWGSEVAHAEQTKN